MRLVAGAVRAADAAPVPACVRAGVEATRCGPAEGSPMCETVFGRTSLLERRFAGVASFCPTHSPLDNPPSSSPHKPPPWLSLKRRSAAEPCPGPVLPTISAITRRSASCD